jgi:FixJ family two-component response regulator
MTGEPTDIVFIVERDDDLRARLSGYLSASGFTVKGFSSAESFLASLPITGPACVVVDQHLPGLSGPDLQRQLLDNPVLAVVFITDSGDVSTVVQAMRDGAVDFLMKPIEVDQLIAAVTRGLQKGTRAETARQVRDTFLSRVEMLTAREREVAMRLVAGRSNKQIASELGTTEKTAKVHRGHVMAKLKVGSVAELIRLAEETRPSPIVPPAPTDSRLRP